MWYEEISEGAHVGTTTHQGVPGGGCTSLWCLLHQNFLNIKKIVLNFQGIFENFYFWVIFLLHEKFKKQTKHGILFYLTNKNRKQKVETEGSAY